MLVCAKSALPQYPPFQPCQALLVVSQWRREIARQELVPIHFLQPLGHGEGVEGVAREAEGAVAILEKRGVDFGNHMFSGVRLPPIKGPEEDPVTTRLPDAQEPGKAGKSRTCHPWPLAIEDAL